MMIGEGATFSWKRCMSEQDIHRFKIDSIFEGYSSTSSVSADRPACLPSVGWKQERPLIDTVLSIYRRSHSVWLSSGRTIL